MLTELVNTRGLPSPISAETLRERFHDAQEQRIKQFIDALKIECTQQAKKGYQSFTRSQISPWITNQLIGPHIQSALSGCAVFCSGYQDYNGTFDSITIQWAPETQSSETEDEAKATVTFADTLQAHTKEYLKPIVNSALQGIHAYVDTNILSCTKQRIVCLFDTRVGILFEVPAYKHEFMELVKSQFPQCMVTDGREETPQFLMSPYFLILSFSSE